MKIISWNVNGLEACKRHGFLKFLKNTNADVFCCQEIKKQCPLATPDYLQFWNPASQPGYSGTLLLSKRQPLSIRYGMGIEQFDTEGRLITAEYEDYYVVNAYVPNSRASPERLAYRIAWDEVFYEYITKLPKPAVICGDFNVARTDLDVYDETAAAACAGYTPQERESFETNFLDSFVDVFRALHPDTRAYTWWSYYSRGREKNEGERIDYWLASPDMMDRIRGIRILDDVFGSDHCPVELEIDA